MACSSGPKIAKSGLVFHYDAHNTQKSWKGVPTVNILTSGTGYNAAIQRSGSTYPYSSVNITSYVLANWSTSNNKLSMSFEGKRDYVVGGTGGGGDGYPSMYIYFSDWSWSASFGIYTYDWSYKALNNITMPNPAGKSVYFSIYHMNNTNPGKSYSRNHQVEFGTFATPFSNGIRSNSEAILDLTKSNIVTANSLVYNANGTFSFNGLTNYASFPIPVSINGPYTIIQWLRPSTPLLSGGSGANKPTGTNRKTSLVGPGPVWNPGIWMTSDYLRVHAKTQYIDAAINWTTTTWNMVGMTYDGTNCRVIFNDKFLPAAFTTPYSPASLSTLYIGAETAVGSSTNWNGDIGVTKFYNRALSESEIKQNFEATRSRYGV